MRNKRITKGIVLFSFSLLFASCVPMSELNALQVQNAKLSEELNVCKTDYKNLKDKCDVKEPIAKTTSNGILFELISITRESEELIIEILMTNKTEIDKELVIDGDDFTAIDENGNNYKSSFFRIGNDAYPVLYSEVPMKATLKIKQMRNSSKSLTILKADDIFENTNMKHFKVEFRNLKID